MKRRANITRLRELAHFVTEGREAVAREFTMRVPAEPERDADLVISTAADEIEALRAEIERLRAELEPAEAEFEVVQRIDGEEEAMAGTSGPRKEALSDAMHYAAAYSQDGPVKVREVIRRDIPREDTNAG